MKANILCTVRMKHPAGQGMNVVHKMKFFGMHISCMHECNVSLFILTVHRRLIQTLKKTSSFFQPEYPFKSVPIATCVPAASPPDSPSLPPDQPQGAEVAGVGGVEGGEGGEGVRQGGEGVRQGGQGVRPRIPAQVSTQLLSQQLEGLASYAGLFLTPV